MMLSNPSQLLLRSPELLTGKRILVVNFPCDGLAHELRDLNEQADITFFTYNFDNAEYVKNNAADKVKIVNSHQIDANKFDLVIYFYPKAKAEALMTLDNIRAVVDEQASLLVVGEKKGGVKSIEKQLKDKASGHKVDSAKHCQLYSYTDIAINNGFDITQYQQSFTLVQTIGGSEYQCDIVSLPGVFNHGKLDDGTALLLDNLPNLSKAKTLLDFGCGAGIIATFACKHYPKIKALAVDVSALATYASAQTFAANEVNGQAQLSDGLSTVEQSFDVILSNPPFHTGLKTDYSITEQFFKTAKQHLHRSGELTLVANSFLDYPEQLSKVFTHHHVLAKTKRFAVYQNK